MLDYRENQIGKKLASNLAKGALLLGAGISLTMATNAMPEVTPAVYGSDNLQGEIHAIAETEVFGPLPVFGPATPCRPPAASGTFLEPAQGVLTSQFGTRWGRRHTGIDIGGEDGSDILASDSGTVVYAGWVDGYGNYLSIDHGNGFQTAYAHCSALIAAEGEHVTQGQRIAYMGSTGNSTGPHLHFEVKKDGVYLNPLDYVLY